MNEAVPEITSRTEFLRALLWAFERSIECGARRIVCVDPDFGEWPLDDAALHERLGAWLRQPQRRLVLLAASFEAMGRHPRFCRWRRLWSHAIDARLPEPGEATDLPTLFVDDADLSVQLIDERRWRGRVEIDAGTARLWRDRVDAVLQRSAPAFAPDSLGL